MFCAISSYNAHVTYAQNPRPTKRRRFEADGFKKPENAIKPRIHVPAFKSAFPDELESRPSPRTANTSNHKMAKLPHRPDFPQTPTKVRSRSTLKANTPATRNVPSLRPPVPESPARSVKTLAPPPAPVPIHPPNDKAKLKSFLASLKPHVDSPARRKIPVPPPPIPQPQTPRKQALKPLKPPSSAILPSAAASSSTSLENARPISKTRIAHFVDPMSESGPTELFALALKGQDADQGGHEVVWITREEKELGRGLVVSPEKAGKGKGRIGGKYIRYVLQHLRHTITADLGL